MVTSRNNGEGPVVTKRFKIEQWGGAVVVDREFTGPEEIGKDPDVAQIAAFAACDAIVAALDYPCLWPPEKNSFVDEDITLSASMYQRPDCPACVEESKAASERDGRSVPEDFSHQNWSREKQKERELEIKAQRRAHKAAKHGRVDKGRFEIVGTVVSVKAAQGRVLGVTETGHALWSTNRPEPARMTVKLDSGERFWGTLPKAIEGVKKGERVAFTASVEYSNDDPNFGFFSRPAKARVLF